MVHMVYSRCRDSDDTLGICGIGMENSDSFGSRDILKERVYN